MSKRQRQIRPDAAEPTATASGDAPNTRMDWMTSVTLLLIAGGALWMIASEGMPIVFDVTSRDFSPVMVVPALFAVLAVYYGVRAGFSTLRLRKYGDSTLTADPLIPGRPFSAVVRTVRDLEPQGPYEICLRCIETVYTGGHGTDGRYRQSVRWEETAHVDAAGVRSSVGIPVRIDVPADVPRTTSLEGGPLTAGIRWVVIAKASLPGLDYKAVFRVVTKTR